MVQWHWRWWSSERGVGPGVIPVLVSVMEQSGVLVSMGVGACEEKASDRRLLFGMMESRLDRLLTKSSLRLNLVNGLVYIQVVRTAW